jgi:hypothetical protein
MVCSIYAYQYLCGVIKRKRHAHQNQNRMLPVTSDNLVNARKSQSDQRRPIQQTAVVLQESATITAAQAFKTCGCSKEYSWFAWQSHTLPLATCRIALLDPGSAWTGALE